MRRQKGFTLIELLIVVAIIGIIAAIAIPNLLNAINRGRQKRSMADMRTIATATEAYAVDNMFYPDTVDMSEMIGFLSTTYIKSMPIADGWGTGFQVQSSIKSYTILSYGRDKSYDGTIAGARSETTTFDCDINYQNGGFMQYPEGTQND
jgi:general secretion pathway protein G